MSDAIHWTCPYCNHDATLRNQDYDINDKVFHNQKPIDGHKLIRWFYIVCPNEKCRKYVLTVGIYDAMFDNNRWIEGQQHHLWNLVPPSRAKVFPEYIPKAILDDYREACLIVELSPKASATLSRRCLQGIIRDFWEVKPGRLLDEITQIKDRTDSLTWEAIDSVRKVGNIGAHMEKDIDLIVDVDPNEAQTLIGLIEILLKDWYLSREERKERLNKIKAIAAVKDGARNSAKS